MLTQDRVRELFDYREDGVLVWKNRANNNSAGSGDVAGGPDAKGYILIGVDGKRYKAHRLIWLWHKGYFPEYGIDHRNRKKWDNRIGNLREEGQVCNARNTGNFTHNTSGVKGVCWHAQRKKWRSAIKIMGKTLFLGLHADFMEAVCLRLAAEQALNWSGCDSSSPAYQYVKGRLVGEVS
jgi:hypothetical protein